MNKERLAVEQQTPPRSPWIGASFIMKISKPYLVEMSGIVAPGPTVPLHCAGQLAPSSGKRCYFWPPSDLHVAVPPLCCRSSNSLPQAVQGVCRQQLHQERAKLLSLLQSQSHCQAQPLILGDVCHAFFSFL